MIRHTLLHFLHQHEDDLTAFAAITALLGLLAHHPLS